MRRNALPVPCPPGAYNFISLAYPPGSLLVASSQKNNDPIYTPANLVDNVWNAGLSSGW